MKITLTQGIGYSGKTGGKAYLARILGTDENYGFAREFLLNDGGLVQLQRILGHSKITTTQIYTKLLDADLAESHRKASPVDRLKR